MNRNFIFVLISLVTLFSIVNAITQFKECVEFPDAELLTVKLTPDPIKPGEQEFKVSVKLNYTITPATIINFDDVDQVNPKLLASYYMDLCSQTDCPVNTGTTFSTTHKFTLPAKLPSKYFIRVYHFLVTPGVRAPFSCAIAIVGS
ncbi:unnamed protein product [Rhizophagus irregularis]|uniref:Phosphatidylglycerol/phosphatidylinositol transfer protein n=1 Tax=Rhizophagus irregularis TaxID=588596 RepID=A0A2N1P2P9_9GLOM|nr:hypothetical protein RhiirC2_704250 [Rhizophagus irregularis]CAB4374326.1 unnamed protein product [Rhizophagus irregularis]